jgi:hypothetical protein
MQDKVNKLIYRAKRRMKNSRDPIHDLNHVKRVVGYVKEFYKEVNLTEVQKQALILAAWWHDAARTITKNPSFLWMCAIDDTASSLMLWFETVRCGLFGPSVGLATRIILCKSLGTGAIFTRFLFRKKDRILIDLISDADAVDMLHQERAANMMKLVEESKFYYFGYKITIWWCVKTSELKVKTECARKKIEVMLKAFLDWIRNECIMDWHIKTFGKKWVDKMLERSMELIEYISKLNSKNLNISY